MQDRLPIADTTVADQAPRIPTRAELHSARKFSGNSLRLKRGHLLYHGTLMYDLDVSLLDRYLKTPPRAPEYRAGRRHGKFVANLPATAAALRASLRNVWQATPDRRGAWRDRLGAPIAGLVRDKYTQLEWIWGRDRSDLEQETQS